MFTKIVIVFLLSFMVMVGKVEAQTSANKLFVQYHLWYTKEDLNQSGNVAWYGWSQKMWGVTNATLPMPWVSPWARMSASRLGLPLAGLYSSNLDLGKIKYDFEQAKAAGIDGMFASVYDGNWQDIFAKHLTVAQQVGMPLGYEAYYGVGPDQPAYAAINSAFGGSPSVANGCTISRNFQINALAGFLSRFKNNPAYLRIDGKPAVWIANYVNDGQVTKDNWTSVWGSGCAPRDVYAWGNATEIAGVMQAVEQKIGEPVAIVMTGPTKDSSGKLFASVPEIVKITTVENIGVFWNTFGAGQQVTPQLGATDKQKYETEYQNEITTAVGEVGDKYALHVYTAFDERGLFPTNNNRGSGLNISRTVITRDGDGMYDKNEGFLKAGLDMASKNNKWVFLESWNDWNEEHQIEPGWTFNNYVSSGDYFSALRKVAAFKGISNPSFSFPDASIVDKPLVAYCRTKQFSGGTVHLTGKFGLAKIDNPQTDGVTLKIQYLNDDTSQQNPSYAASTNWVTVAAIKKAYTGGLQDFDIDITRYLDQPGLRIRVEADRDANQDMVYFPELKLNWYGTEINLLNDGALKQFSWSSQGGNVAWRQETSLGVATMRNSVLLEDGKSYPLELFVNPNWNVGGNTFIQMNINWQATKILLPRCDGVKGVAKTAEWFKAYTQNKNNNYSDYDNDGQVTTKDLKLVIGNM